MNIFSHSGAFAACHPTDTTKSRLTRKPDMLSIGPERVR
jgi:hypothetical protein